MKELSIIEHLESLEQFKISCSQIGKIVGESKTRSYKDKILAQKALIQETQDKFDAMKDGKMKDKCALKITSLQNKLIELQNLELDEIDKPQLSETAKTYCENWLKGRMYGIKKQIVSKYLEKGNREEGNAILYCERVFEGSDGWFMAQKNTERRSNEWIEGECDLELTEEIVDIKNSFDFTTFPLFKKEIPDTDYEWQLNGYMWLWGKEKGRVVYCLMSLPEDMIIKECWKHFGYGVTYTDEEFVEFTARFRYDDFPRELRIKEYRFDFDEKKIEQIIFKVGECRKYIASLIEDMKNNLKEIF